MTELFANREHDKPSETFPFGENIKTLIVCVNKEQRKNVQDAYKIPAMYILPGTPLGGRGPFEKIIIHVPHITDGAELVRFKRWVDEQVLIKTTYNPEVYYV